MRRHFYCQKTTTMSPSGYLTNAHRQTNILQTHKTPLSLILVPHIKTKAIKKISS